jgi:hypothetical protein
LDRAFVALGLQLLLDVGDELLRIILRRGLAKLALDLAGRRFDAVVMAGNVMIFVAPGTEGAVLKRSAAHLRTGGLVVAGFQLVPGGLTLEHYDDLAAAAGLILAERFATSGMR